MQAAAALYRVDGDRRWVVMAGLAFAVGMVVDAAIVVMENIYRLRERGEPAPVAAYRGASQVWGAVLVSALTTA